MSGMRGTIALALVVALGALACQRQSGVAGPEAAAGQPKPPQAPAAAAAPAASEPAAALADERPAYDPTGKRDPFRSFVLDQIKKVESDSAKGPLEQFELSQLSLLGVVWETNNRRALVGDPSGRGYIVKEGDRIGKNEGRVLVIGDNLMQVREVYEDYVGEKTAKDIELRVRQGQGG